GETASTLPRGRSAHPSPAHARRCSPTQKAHSCVVAAVNLRFPWRQLVCKLWPLAFNHGPHFIRDMVDVFDLQHVFVEALKSAGIITLSPTRRAHTPGVSLSSRALRLNGSVKFDSLSANS